MDIEAMIAEVEPRPFARASLLGWHDYLLNGLGHAERTSNTTRIAHYRKLIEDLRSHLEGRINGEH